MPRIVDVSSCKNAKQAEKLRRDLELVEEKRLCLLQSIAELRSELHRKNILLDGLLTENTKVKRLLKELDIITLRGKEEVREQIIFNKNEKESSITQGLEMDLEIDQLETKLYLIDNSQKAESHNVELKPGTISSRYSKLSLDDGKTKDFYRVFRRYSKN